MGFLNTNAKKKPAVEVSSSRSVGKRAKSPVIQARSPLNRENRQDTCDDTRDDAASGRMTPRSVAKSSSSKASATRDPLHLDFNKQASQRKKEKQDREAMLRKATCERDDVCQKSVKSVKSTKTARSKSTARTSPSIPARKIDDGVKGEICAKEPDKKAAAAFDREKVEAKLAEKAFAASRKERSRKAPSPTDKKKGNTAAYKKADAKSLPRKVISRVEKKKYESSDDESYDSECDISEGTESDEASSASSHSSRFSSAESQSFISGNDSSVADSFATGDFDTQYAAADNKERKQIDPNHQAFVSVAEHGNVEKLKLQELKNIPGIMMSTDVIIKIECSSVTLQDCMIRRGKWYDMQRLPFIPGSDLVGTIVDLGTDALREGRFCIGERVAAVVPSGGNAKYIRLDYQCVIRVPDGVDPVMALCLSSTYVPAREALDLARKMNTPFTGANVLVIGGNGPSGLATIELLTLEGANIYTTADERHHEFLANFGAKCFPIDPLKWIPQLKGKMDVVLDSVCLDSFYSSLAALNPEGTLICTGLSAVYTQGQIRAPIIKDARDVKAAYVKLKAKFFMNNTIYYDRMVRYNEAPNEYAQHFRYLCHLVGKGTIKPAVAARASLNMVPFLHKAIEHGDTPYGVCVCAPWVTKVE